MEHDVEAYVKSCLVCQLDKIERKKEAGLLQPLPIPEEPWQSVISGFPKVNGFSSNMVLVDRFSKYAVFIAAPTECPSNVAAELFFKNVVKYFGMPKDVISDRDAWFTAAYRYGWDRQAIIKEATDSLAKAQRRMKKYADKHRRPLEFRVGEKVLLKLTPRIWKNIGSRVRHRALVSRYEGPFEVAYRLILPERMKIHPTCHVSFLKPYVDDPEDPDRHKTKRAPSEMRTQLEEKIEKVLDHRVLGMHKKNRRTEFLIQWKGKLEADATWEKGDSLWQYEHQVED
ncbi:uncharacterized protein LOC142172786 [Nicotiana tabacum]|uniref:Uncharacterized protein LOC142172786 n=1 Tax=Nicotiana tabacum TaxID=4097 RepID=A0AC58T5S8_TOBAC